MAAYYSSDIITAAFLKCGIDSQTTAQNTAAFNSLNNMIRMWGAERLAYSVVTESFTMYTTTATYHVGVTATGIEWGTATGRPLDVLSCYLRDSNSYDHPVRIFTWQDYNTITNKAFSARPTEVNFSPEFYSSSLVSAKLRFDTVPDQAYTAYFEFLKPLSVFVSSTTTCYAPDEYLEAFIYNLAVSISEDYNREIKDTVIAKAILLKETISRNLAAQRVPPKARFDGTGTAGYDITNDIIV